jgi:hypothetical protein
MPRMARAKNTLLRSARNKSSAAKSCADVAGRIPTEHEEQREFVAWFRRQYPDVRIFAIPNGGARSQREGGRFKLEGVSAGVPDLYIPAWRCWVEMKRQKGGSLSADQKDWRDYLQSIGDLWFVCKGCEDAKKIIIALFSK